MGRETTSLPIFIQFLQADQFMAIYNCLLVCLLIDMFPLLLVVHSNLCILPLLQSQ